MLFRKRKKHGGAPASKRQQSASEAGGASFYRITFDNLLKGSVVTRNRGPVRQFAVVVHGSVRLVTSGDTVDRETYQALLAAGAVKPSPSPVTGEPSGPPSVATMPSPEVEPEVEE